MNTCDDTHSEQLNELFAALSKAQSLILSATKDKTNPFFKSKYSDLADVWDACRGPLTSNGLTIVQTIEGTKESMFIITWLGHTSGQWMKSKLPLMPTKPDHQSVGSAISYGRRYALSAMVGVVSELDDDGEAAMKGARKQEPQVIDAKQVLADFMKAVLPNDDSNEEQWILDYLNAHALSNKHTVGESCLKYQGKLGTFQDHLLKYKEKIMKEQQ